MTASPVRPLRVLVWHVHGSWTTSLVHGGHTYLLPTRSSGDCWGRGRAGRPWPESAVEVPVEELAHTPVDVVVLQRQEELELVHRWLGRRPGEDVPAVFVEHNTPKGDVPNTRHPMADRPDLPVVHVTHFNNLVWDTGTAPVVVIPHGIVDPGERYSGELERAAVVVNEPVRRWRVTGTDLLPAFARALPLDVFGMGLADLGRRTGVGEPRLTPVGDLDTARLHEEMARRRVYLHTARWTSLGLSLLEAMHLGMPVVALASTEAVRAVPAEAGVVSADVAELTSALTELAGDHGLATRMGKAAREFALDNYGLDSFLHAWDVLFERLLDEWEGVR
ncbi:glycosyltransferase [Amycolatopsis suaedae]|uniref:Glycosyltransferase n=1 Tax=Amycolatopsis suaedae TaxID=2510978 RepID=A0A4Q7J1G3_9PSEU|nr:glycosyltransferase [Amycolatopsis suaedae]RZQ60233.1 glycosyltransferase [Amycolatopsis suaedae]